MILKTSHGRIKFQNDLSPHETVIEGADLSGICSNNCEDKRINLRGLIFKNTNLDHANFDHTDLSAAKLIECNLDYSMFCDTLLSDASLRGSTFYEAMILGMDFTSTDLTQTSFTGTNLQGCNFKDLDLSHTIFAKSAMGWLVDIRGSDFRVKVLPKYNLQHIKYNHHTQFPNNFDPEQSHMVFEK